VWRGESVPDKPVRGMYFATHFHNFYHDAPTEKIEEYVEELALWGINVLLVWFDMHHFTGIDDPAAQAMIERLSAILRAAKRIGLKAGVGVLGNEAYNTSPEHLRADWTAGHDGYFAENAHYHVEVCPSTPEGRELILKGMDEEFAAFEPVGLDYLWIWPYDQGGCSCSKCVPWGANGFVRIAKDISEMFRRRYPSAKVALSTWCFEYTVAGEWEGLARAFATRPDWLDHLLVDTHGYNPFPPYPLAYGAPGGLPMINFPEISMFENDPWGGYGANPFPAFLERRWAGVHDRLGGGFPYSEGIFEDLNKAVCAGLFWDEDRPAMDIVREYIASEFSPEVVEQVARAVEIMEHNLPHVQQVQDGVRRVAMRSTEGAGEAWELLQEANCKLLPEARKAWRWRIVYLRGLIDNELAASGGVVTEACDEAFRELFAIYHAENAEYAVRPPVG
jgi:hypothetical protein